MGFSSLGREILSVLIDIPQVFPRLFLSLFQVTRRINENISHIAPCKESPEFHPHFITPRLWSIIRDRNSKPTKKKKKKKKHLNRRNCISYLWFLFLWNVSHRVARALWLLNPYRISDSQSWTPLPVIYRHWENYKPIIFDWDAPKATLYNIFSPCWCKRLGVTVVLFLWKVRSESAVYGVFHHPAWDIHL